MLVSMTAAAHLLFSLALPEEVQCQRQAETEQATWSGVAAADGLAGAGGHWSPRLAPAWNVSAVAVADRASRKAWRRNAKRGALAGAGLGAIGLWALLRSSDEAIGDHRLGIAYGAVLGAMAGSLVAIVWTATS